PVPTHIYTLSLHDALPILLAREHAHLRAHVVLDAAVPVQVIGTEIDEHGGLGRELLGVLELEGGDLAHDGRGHIQLSGQAAQRGDRKSTRLNSSHLVISYA